MNSIQKKILVTLDGSGHALDTVRYLTQILPPARVELVLFSVLTREPEYFLDSEATSPLGESSAVTSDWETLQKSALQSFMDSAHQLFTDRGFPAEGVKVKLQKRKVGVARDIISEVHNGYDAVVVGRQGMNPISRLVIGSVASKLIESLTNVPVWLIGKTTGSNKILVAMDGSEGSLRAVQHLGGMVGGASLEFTLLRVIRGVNSNSPGQGSGFNGAAGSDNAKKKPDEESAAHAVFEKASQILVSAGIPQDQITTKIISGVATRSGSIIAQAMSGGYGTIVLGRRGHSEVGEFHMGRVTNKVVQLAGRMAVWLVS